MSERLLIAGLLQNSDGDSVECNMNETRPSSDISAQKFQDFLHVVVVTVKINLLRP